MHEKASLMKVNFSLKFLLIYRGFFISMQLFLLHYHPIILTPFIRRYKRYLTVGILADLE